MAEDSKPGTSSARIAGIDLARALAIIGMLAVHVGPTYLDDTAGRMYAMSHGRASILFALVAGVGVSLLAASRRETPGGARLKLAWRALLLLPLGLWLQELDHNILVILQDYAILFVVGMFVITLPSRWLLGLAVATGVLGPLGFLAGRVYAPLTFDRTSVSLSDPIGEIIHGLVLSGPYPLITWAAPFLFGMWIGRLELRAPAVQWLLVLCGGLATLLTWQLAGPLQDWAGYDAGGWTEVVRNDPHCQMPLWLAGSTGSAAMALGLSLIAAKALGRVVWPLVATGQLAFTVYVGHLLALHQWRAHLTSREVSEAITIVLGITIVAAATAIIWRAMLPRGPLESLLHLPWDLASRFRKTDPED